MTTVESLSSPLRGPSRAALAVVGVLAVACGPAADPGPSPKKDAGSIAPAIKPAPPEPAPAKSPEPIVTPPEPPSGPLRAQGAGAYRPCELAVASCMKDGKPCAEEGRCHIILAHVIPEGAPLDMLLARPDTLRWRYAADERVLEGPGYEYRHIGADRGLRTPEGGGEGVKVTFDDKGRLREIGESRLEYTPDGRTAGSSNLVRRGKWAQTVTYAWAAAPQQTYEVRWTYPDSDEFCEPSPSTVEVDAQGRISRMVYDDCGINYSQFNLSYQYDAANRVTAIDVECPSYATTWRLNLKYECP